MKNDKSNKPDTSEGTATTVTTVEEETTTTDETTEVELTPQEEKVIRMRHGRSLEGHEALEFAVGATEETKQKLALIEANLLDAFEAEALDPDPKTGAPRSVVADRLE